MFATGQRVYFLQDNQLHEGLIQRECKHYYTVLENDSESPDGLTMWHIAPNFLGTSYKEAILAHYTHQKRCLELENVLEEARSKCQVKPNMLATINSPKHGTYTGYVLKVNRTTVDLYTEYGFRRADKCLVET